MSSAILAIDGSWAAWIAFASSDMEIVIFGNSFMDGHRATPESGSRYADDSLDEFNGPAELVSSGVAELAAAVFLRVSSTCAMWDRRGSCFTWEASVWSMDASGRLASQGATTISIASAVAPNKI